MKRNVVIFTVVAVLVLFAWVFGWLPRNRDWQAASGWLRISEGDRPAAGVSDVLFAASPDGPRIRWIGHSGFIIEWSGTTLMLDPNLQQRVTLSRRFLETPSQVLTNSIDAVCISHAHFDHMSPETLRGFARIGTVVVPQGSEEYLEMPLPGEPEIRGLAVGASTTVGPLTITAVPARHNGCRYHPWRSKYIAVGYVITDTTNTLYFAGDTGYQPVVNDFIRTTYVPDTAILPIGAYAPRFPFKVHHMDPAEAARAAMGLGVTLMIPCHFATYRMTLDPPSRALPVFARIASRQGLNWSMPAFYE